MKLTQPSSAKVEKKLRTNNAVISEALATIHSRRAGIPRIYSTVTGESVAMDDSCILITPIMYYQPLIPCVCEDLWERADIGYAIVCNPAHPLDWNETDSCISWSERSRAKIIFERVGAFYDMGRSYNPSDFKFA